MIEEYKALIDNVTPNDNKWVYHIKLTNSGSLDKYKAQVVAKRYNQVEGIYYAKKILFYFQATNHTSCFNSCNFHELVSKEA